MQPQMLGDTAAKPPWLTVHSLSQEDSLAATALRAAVAAVKGKLGGTAARGPFDDIMKRVAVPTDVDVRRRYRRRDRWLVGEAGTTAETVRRSFTCMAAGSTSEPPTRTGISSGTSHRALELMRS